MIRHAEYTKDDDVRETPPDLFARLNAECDYTIDACALPKNTKCRLFYAPDGLYHVGDDGSIVQAMAGVNGLTGAFTGMRVFCNPPFSEFELWVPWAWRNSDAELITMIAPATRSDRPWWQKWVEPYRDDQPERRHGPSAPEELCSDASWRVHVNYTERVEFLEDGHPIYQKDRKTRQVKVRARGRRKGEPLKSSAMFGLALLEWRHVS